MIIILKRLLVGLSAIILLAQNGYAFDGPGVELIGSGACAFIVEGSDGSFTQVRVPAKKIIQRHLGVPNSDSVPTGTCRTKGGVVQQGIYVPPSWSDLMTLGIDLRCHNVSARTECNTGTWTQEVLSNQAVRVNCICSEDPL